MRGLRVIDDKFIDEYIISHRNDLGKSNVGGTDWRFVDIIAPAFKEILEISKPDSILEIGFNKGGGALLFLSIDPKLIYDSIDIVGNETSSKYLSSKYAGWNFHLIDSKKINPGDWLLHKYDLAVIDGDHSYDGVMADIKSVLRFQPNYILFDDVLHPSHYYIHQIITENYKSQLEVVKMWEFNELWKGYSMALCKVK